MIKDALRTIGIYIDVAVYWIVENLFQLIMDLSNVEIFSESIIDEFSSRIYVILGLVMVFKLMISFIQMLINPDKMSDKEQGAGNLLKRVVISLALIFLVPSIFDLARQVQGEIIPLIPKVVLGTTVDATDEATSEKISSVGRLMAFYSFSPFFTYQNESCNDGSIMGTGVNDDEADIWSVSSAASNITKEDNCSTDPDGYKYSYSWPFSTLVGAYLVYVLVTIAVAIAVRTIKLSMCELVAPIPIASYIDPKTSKQTFDKWVSTTLKTYADLFIRLVIVYFVIFVFQVLFSGETGIMEQILANVGGNVFRKGLVVVFIIVGLLQFAKQAPKFLTDMLGLSGAGDYFASMVKGEGWKALGETGHVAANLAKAPISNWKELSNTVYANGSKPKFLRKVGSSVAGLAGVTGRTALAIATGKSGAELTKNPFDNTTKRRNDRIATKNRRISGYSWREEQTEKWRRSMNISPVDDWAVAEYNEYKDMADFMGEAGALGLKKGEEQAHKIPVSFAGHNISYKDLQTIAAANVGEKIRGIDVTGDLKADAANLALDIQKGNKPAFYAKLLSGSNPDSGAVQIYNKIVDRFNNTSAYSNKDTVKVFKEKLFDGNPTVSINGQTFSEKDFDYNTLRKIVNSRDLFATEIVQVAFKNASETLRDNKQIAQYEADRRNKMRSEANKGK